jgi:tRNA-specific 2-thiouridylase
LKEQAKTKKYKLIFNKPQKAITPGQSVVFYNKQQLLGGGIIDY